MAPTETIARPVWREVLADLLEVPIRERRVGAEWDDVVSASGHTFAIEYKSRGDAATIAGAIERMKRRSRPLSAVPLLVVPQMGEVGRALCRAHAVAWIDLAGNAEIDLEGLRIRIRGERAERLRLQGSVNIFAPMSSRIAHLLLLRGSDGISQSDLVQESGLSKGLVSRIVSEMESRGLVTKTAKQLRARNPEVLLDAWREAYRLPEARLLKGVLPARSAEDVVASLHRIFDGVDTEHVFGGLAAAWLLDRHAAFNLVTCHLLGAAPAERLRAEGFLEASGGANVWIIQDSPLAPQLGKRLVEGIPVTSPYLTYVELIAHPERASEAAEHLRSALPLHESSHER